MSNPARSLRSLLAAQWFLILLAVSLAIGFLASEAVAVVGHAPGVKPSLVAGVLFLMGVTLRPQAVRHSLRRPAACALALALNIIAVPGLAYIASIPLPSHLGAGLIVAAAVPCTLASASVWTRKGKGNDAVSMLVTLVTNLLCFAIAPATLTLLIGRNVEIDFLGQAEKLALLVVLPIAAAQLLRLRRRVAESADHHKTSLTTVAQLGLLLMVAIGASETMTSLSADQAENRSNSAPLANPLMWVAITGGLACLTHTIVLLGGYKISGTFKMPEEDRVAVAIAGSQKTLMVGLQIAIDCGVSMLPMILYHVGQLIIDTIWVDRRNRSQSAILQRSTLNQSSSSSNPAAHSG